MNKTIFLIVIIILLNLCVSVNTENASNFETNYYQIVDKEQLIIECENELEKHKECFDTYLESDVIIGLNDYYFYKDILTSTFCLSVYSDKCKSFYDSLITNQSVCSLAKQYKSFENINSFDEKEYERYNEMCQYKIDYACRIKLMLYEDCNVENFINDQSLYTKACVDFKSDKCQDFYQQDIENVISLCHSVFSESENFENDIPDSNKLKLQYEKSNELCKDVLSNPIESCENEMEKYEKCQYDISSIVNDNNLLLEKCAIFNSRECIDFFSVYELMLPICSYAKPFFNYDLDQKLSDIMNSNSIICNGLIINDQMKKSATEACENELKKYDECLFKYSLELTNDELSQKCSVYNSEKCQSFYHRTEDFPICAFANRNSYFEFTDNGLFSRKSLYNDDINIYDKICNQDEETIIESCKKELKVFEKCLLDDKEAPSDEEKQEQSSSQEILSKQCRIFRSINCEWFYQKNIDSLIQSCFAAERYQPVLDKIHELSISGSKYKYYEENCPVNNNPWGDFNNHAFSMCGNTFDLENGDLGSNDLGSGGFGGFGGGNFGGYGCGFELDDDDNNDDPTFSWIDEFVFGKNDESYEGDNIDSTSDYNEISTSASENEIPTSSDENEIPTSSSVNDYVVGDDVIPPSSDDNVIPPSSNNNVAPPSSNGYRFGFGRSTVPFFGRNKFGFGRNGYGRNGFGRNGFGFGGDNVPPSSNGNKFRFHSNNSN